MARERAGYATAAEACRRFGFEASTYRAHESGYREFPAKKAALYARAYRVNPEWLLYGRGDDRKKPVPLVGYVGAGAEVWPFDDGAGALDEIDPPPGVRPEAVAVKVQGDSMYPRYFEGDLLIYDRHLTASAADGKECVVRLVDGRTLVKIVRIQPNGRATLESWNAPPIRNAELEFAAPVMWVLRAGTW